MRIKLLKLTFLFLLFTVSANGQSLITFQNWEGQTGDGNWAGAGSNGMDFTRGEAAAAVYQGRKSLYVTNGGQVYDYDEGTASEVYVVKEIDFPSSATFDIEITFNWKCVGEVGYDYMKAWIVDRSITNPFRPNIESYSGTVIPLNGGNEFSGQNTFTTFNETLPASVEGRTDLQLIFTWTNDGSIQNGVPMAIDNIIVSLGPPVTTLSGDYYVGSASNAYFPSLTLATYFLNSYGLSSDVRFLLTDALYDDTVEDYPIVIENFNESPPSSSSNSYTLTIKPDIGVDAELAGAVNGAQVVDALYYSAMITLLGADNVIIDGSNNGTNSRNLTITNSNVEDATGVFILSEAPAYNENIELKNLIIENEYSNFSYAIGVGIVNYIFDHASAGFDNIIVENNLFKKGDYGVFVRGGVSGNVNGSNLEITNNDLEQGGAEAIYNTGIFAGGVDNLSISNNVIGNINSSANQIDYGVHLGSAVSNAVIEKNEIHDISHTNGAGYAGIGMRISSATSSADIVVKNNVIYGISGDGNNLTDNNLYDRNPTAILLSSTQSGVSIYNNSIYLSGNTLNRSNAVSSCILLNTGSSANIRNNIFNNELGLAASTGLGSFGMIARNASSQFENTNYNCFYINSSGAGNNYVGRIGSTNYSDMSSWRALTLGNEASIFADPGFISGTNLVPDETSPNAWFVNGTGVQLTNVSDDFNGNFRSTTKVQGAPDIGAYEITPSSTPNDAVVGGTHSAGMTETFTVGTRKIAEITWGSGGTLPSVNSFKYYSGSNPPNIKPSDANYMNCYFNINATGGSGYSYEVRFFYDSALFGLVPSENDLRLSKNDGSGWVTYESATPNISNNSIAVASLTSFSAFTGTDINAPLPVDLISFEGTKLEFGIFLKWLTASELNNDYFELERSYDRNSFETIGMVQGKGTTYQETEYQFFDQSVDLKKIKVYYRLKQVDTDGSFKYSKVIVVNQNFERAAADLYPNPAENLLYVKMKEWKGVSPQIKIYTIDGRSVDPSYYSYKNEFETITINVSELDAQVYLLELINSNARSFHRFLKK